jgi:hypothetical protein
MLIRATLFLAESLNDLLHIKVIKQVVSAVTVETRVCEVVGSNIVWDTGYILFQFLHTDLQSIIIIVIMKRILSSTKCTVW